MLKKFIFNNKVGGNVRNNTILFAIFVFLMLISSTMAETIYIQRPWKINGWVELHSDDIGNKTTIDNLNLGDVLKLNTNEKTRTDLLNAKTNADLYYSKYDEIEKYAAAHGGRPDLVVDLVGGCAAGAIPMAIAGALVAGVGAIPGGIVGCIVGAGGGLFTYLEQEDEKEREAEWLTEQYLTLAKYWQATMDASMDALEESQKTADAVVNNASKQYEKLEYAGLCEPQYIYPGGDECREMRTAFNIIKNNESEARYGQVNTLKSDIISLNQQLVSNINASLYPQIMNKIWGENGIIATFQDLYEKGKEAEEKANKTYDDYYTNATDAQSYAKQKYDEAEKQSLEKITEAKTLTEFEKTKIGIIAERWNNLKNKKSEADNFYNNAKGKYSAKSEHYLLIGIQGMEKAASLYKEIETESTGLLEDAKSVVEEKRTEAVAKIEEAKTQMKNAGYGDDVIASKIKDAENALSAGDSATSLGEKYAQYVKAIALANGAMPTKTSEYNMEYQKTIAELEDLLNRAEQDGVYVADLKAELEFIKTTRPANEMEYLAEIKKELETRIASKYSQLEEKRKELLEKLNAANATDLIEKMKSAEFGIVGPNGEINWLDAVGKLRTLASSYDSIEASLESDLVKRNDMIANQLIISPSLVLPPVNIDQATSFTYIVSIYNPKNYGGKEITISVPLEGEFRLNYVDIKDGADGVLGVSTVSKTAKITLASIGAFEKKTIVFEKSAILATTKSKEIKATGIGGGAANVNEKIVFQLYVDDAQINTTAKNNCLIDGGDCSRKLPAGVHTLTSDYMMYDAYTEERTNADISVVNGKTTVKYSINVKPNINLDEVPVIIEDTTASGLTSNLAVSCGFYNCVKQSAGSIYLVNLQNVKKGSTAVITVSYSINNVSAYVNNYIAMYENSTEPSIREMAEEAKQLLAQGDETGALRKVEEIKKTSANLENEKAKLLKEYYELVRKITNEIEDLTAAIDKAKNLGMANDSEIAKLMTRKATLEELLNESSVNERNTKKEIEDALDKLKAIDTNWLNKEVDVIAKQATKNLADYKKQLNGFAEAELPLKTLENDINVLLATEKATDAIQVLYDLKQTDALQKQLLEERNAKLAKLKEDYEALKATASDLLTKYEKEYSDAKNAKQLEDLFSLAPTTVRSTMSDIESALKAGDFEKVNYTIENKFKKQIASMNNTITMLQGSANRKIGEIQEVLDNKKIDLSPQQISDIEQKLTAVKGTLASGSYAKTIIEADNLINYINGLKGNAGTSLYLILASVGLVGLAAYFFYVRQKKKSGPSGGFISLEKERKS